MLKIMKDEGLDRGLVQKFETSDRRSKDHFYGFRKMFWKYLNKLNVPFFDQQHQSIHNLHWLYALASLKDWQMHI